MSKTRTNCTICDGTYDGTPSGKKRHEASNQHRTAAAFGAPTQAELRPKSVDIAPSLPLFPYTRTGTADDGLAQYAQPSIDTALYDAKRTISEQIVEAEGALARRVRDHGWQSRHRTAEVAAAYHAKKVLPLEAQLAELRPQVAAAQQAIDEAWKLAQAPIREYERAVGTWLLKVAGDTGFQITGLPGSLVVVGDRENDRYATSVYWPRIDGFAAGTIEPAGIQTTSYGRVDPDTAQLLVRQLQTAIRVAELLNRAYPAK